MFIVIILSAAHNVNLNLTDCCEQYLCCTLNEISRSKTGKDFGVFVNS